MAAFDAKRILAKLDALRTKDEARRVFGASSHGYALAPKLSERDVVSVEKQFRTKLPDDYRTFLMEVGAGGAGPGHGIFPLVRKRGKWRWEGDGAELTGNLARPFPHTKKWNIRYPAPEPRDPSDAYWVRRDKWNAAVYWNPKQTPGAICICHEGCAIRDWLVVNGKERGRVWSDLRVDDVGLVPQRITFGDWYLAWLSSATRSAARAR